MEVNDINVVFATDVIQKSYFEARAMGAENASCSFDVQAKLYKSDLLSFKFYHEERIVFPFNEIIKACLKRMN